MEHNKAEPRIENLTLVDGSSDYYQRENIVIRDWSQTGRGSHVDFGDDEVVPLQPGRFLGRGAVGDVHEITLQGCKLAHKKIFARKKVDEEQKKEIEILKRLSHFHVIQLIGTYTQQSFLGILLYPVAICDLHTFFEDIEAWTRTQKNMASRVERLSTLEPAQKERLEELGYNFPQTSKSAYAMPIYTKIGCLVSAIVYLHEQKIRHKDLKPSNVLLSRDRLWVSDFGSATDFTLLSQSATDNERGTPRYFAPEMAEWQPCGRAADIFSLGCILFEVLVLHRTGGLDPIRKNRSSDPSFHKNLDSAYEWLSQPTPVRYKRASMLRMEIRDMLSKDPQQRPNAGNILAGVVACDLKRRPLSRSLFGDCCRVELVPAKQVEKQASKYEMLIQNLEEEIEAGRERTKYQEARIKAAEEESARVWDMYTKYHEEMHGVTDRVQTLEL